MPPVRSEASRGRYRLKGPLLCESCASRMRLTSCCFHAAPARALSAIRLPSRFFPLGSAGCFFLLSAPRVEIDSHHKRTNANPPRGGLAGSHGESVVTPYPGGAVVRFDGRTSIHRVVDRRGATGKVPMHRTLAAPSTSSSRMPRGGRDDDISVTVPSNAAWRTRGGPCVGGLNAAWRTGCSRHVAVRFLSAPLAAWRTGAYRRG